ncbi:MAG: calcium-binding protein, partial [bacterium]|nr:calcium-binding protein [bacterium]
MSLTATGTATSGSDYTLPQAFTIAEGETTATATVQITDDDLDEGNETIILSATVSGLSVTGVTVTITDDDTHGVTVSTGTVSVVEGATAEYTVVLDSEPTANVVVAATSGTQAKATVAPASHTFTPSNWDTAQKFTVTGVEAGTSAITHAATSDDTQYSGETVSSVTATVTKAPGVTVSAEMVSVADGSTATYTVVLDTQPSGDVTVAATSGATGKATVSGAVTFTTGNWDAPKTFTVTGQGAGSATITHAVTASADSGYPTGLSIGSVAVTVTAVPGVSVSAETVSVVDGSTVEYTVVFDTQPSGDVTVTATSGTPAKATVSGAVTFTTGNWNVPKTFTVTGVDPGTSAITHAVTLSADTDYPTSLSIDSVAVTV